MALNGQNINQHLSTFYAQCSNMELLLAEAVRVIHESGSQFHWTGIYILFPDNTLRLGPFIGEPTDHTLIPVGQGVCGSAVSECRNKVIPDVSQEANYLSCSFKTKSEAVILIQKNGKIFGQIDIDSHKLDAFDPKMIEEIQVVADWLAGIYEQRSKFPTRNEL